MSGYNPFRHRKTEHTTTIAGQGQPPLSSTSLPVASDEQHHPVEQYEQHHHSKPAEAAASSPERPLEAADPFQAEANVSYDDYDDQYDDDDGDDDSTLDDTVEDTFRRSSNDSFPAAGRQGVEVGMDTNTAVQALPVQHPKLVRITAGSRRRDGSAAVWNGVSNNDHDLTAPTILPGNSQKKPPPPPRSHHGKLIGRNKAISGTPPSLTTMSSGSSENAIPFRRPSIDRMPAAAYSNHDYFATPLQTENQSPSPSPELTHSLGRSQSQSKRPPTPPLSRRQSHMRRTRTEPSSKTNRARLSLQADHMQLRESPRWSPTASSFASAQLPDRSTHHPAQFEEVKPGGAASIPGSNNDATDMPTESPLSAQSTSSTSNRALKHLSQPALPTTPAIPPPPPPPRRLRGSSRGSTDGPRPKSMVHDDKQVEIFPHPSNASDILADLSKLQKEVDDLRGNFERRKGSH